MIEIYSFFSIIITKYLVRDPLCPELLEVVGHIFNWDRSLHTDVLPKYHSDELRRYEQRNAQDEKRLERERRWREQELKVGDEVDVLKRVKVRSSTISGWVRGTVVYRGEAEDEDLEGTEREREEELQVKVQ